MVTGTTSVAQPTSVTAAPNVTSSERPADSATPPRRASDNRRSNKPIMEKRRRARINNCLNELKALILDAMKKDPARHSKLEKADILEMTVKHLENLQRQQVAMSAAADPSVLNKFRAGFSECAGEVGRFPGLEPAVKRRLLQHLATCLSGASPGGNTPQQTPQTNTATGTVTVPVQPRQEQPTQLQVHILPTATAATATLDTHNIIFSNGAGAGVQLVPTRLPNGDIALVLPTAGHQAALFRQQQQQHQQQQQQQHQPASPPPMLVPIPTRTASTASASSATSSTSSGLSAPTLGAYSAPSSPEPDVRMLYSPPAQKPLSLVIRKTYQPAEEEKPWRPW